MRKTKSLILMFVLICFASVLGWSVNAQKRLVSQAPLIKEASRRGPVLWEYNVVVVQGSATMSVDDLNRWGGDGWELTGVQRDGTTTFMRGDESFAGTYYYFKRPQQ